MPPSWFPFRCLVLLLLAASAGFLARPAEAAKQPFADIVAAAAERHGVDPDLVHAVIAVESGYRATAQSPVGAQGLMQLMPGTQRDFGVSDAFDPRQNVDAGVAYLRRLTDEFGTVLALAAYNAGPGAVRRYNGIPPYPETRAYLRAVLDRDRPAAGAQATEKHDPSGDRALAVSEAGLAEGVPVDHRLQDDNRAMDAAAGLEPRVERRGAWSEEERRMTTRILALVMFNVLAASAVASAGGPAQWDERAVQGGVEFWLLNDEGIAIVLRCANHQDVHASFVFTEPIEAARGALVIGQMAGVEPGRIFPPHRRRNFPVAQVNDRTVQIVNGPGLDFTLAMLGAAANMHVRTAGRRASFEVAGSDSMLAQCPGAVGRSPATFGWPGAPGHTGDALGPVPRDMSPSG